MFIEIFGFYIHFLPLYDVYIMPWGYILSKKTGTLFAKIVDVTDAKPLYTSVPKVLKMLNECIVSETTIAIPDTSRMF